MDLPYLTADLPGTGGALRRTPEDFQVDELPLYEPCGEGEHVYAHVWKRGIATFEAVRRIARALDVDEHKVAYAGLKDARAVTTQWISVEGTTEEAVREMVVDKVAVLDVSRHGNRLKLGHLAGNRFRILVRGAKDRERARAILDVLQRRGAPNYFGEQRFGTRLNSHRCGEAIIRRDYQTFVDRLLGGPPGPERDPYLTRARAHYDAGRLKDALQSMPIRQRTEKKALHALVRFGEPERAFFAIPKRMRQMFVSSFQSHLFNEVLKRRLDRMDSLEEGDLAYLHRNGAVFTVEDLAVERPRLETFEISPSGPLFGTKMPLADGHPGEIERAVLAEADITLDDFRVGGGLSARGGRRALRIPLPDATFEPVDETGFAVAFTLPPGAYATVVMREIMKT